MKIFRKSLFLVLLISLFSINAWGDAPPRIVSSSPADLQRVSPATLGITIHFNETMTGSGYWSFSSPIWSNSTYDWSADRKTLSIVRNNVNDPLPEGSYWFRFNPAGHTTDFKSSATGLPLPTTTIHFTVSNNVNNNGDVIPPQVVSSLPANGATINQSINSITITFDEAMDEAGAHAWSVSNGAWGNSNLSSWSQDKRSLTILRQGMHISPLTDGIYTFTLNPANAINSLTDTSGNQLAQTTVSFTLNSNANQPGNRTYYIPYFKNDNGGWWTGVGISNNNDLSAATFTATIFSQTGNILMTSNPPLTISPYGQFSGTLGDGLNTTGWIEITSNNVLSGLCFTGLNLMADIPFVSDLSTTLMIPHVAQNPDWDTSVMVCNPNNSPVSLRLVYFSKEGHAQTFDPPAIVASGSAVYELGNAFAAALPIRGGKVVLSVTQGGGIAAFALYSNQKKGLNNFAGISAVPVAPIAPVANPNNPF